MRVAVIGASSFSGAAFVRRLAGEHISCEMFHGRKHMDLNVHLGSILARIAETRCDAVVNFAALNMVGESWVNYADYYRTNVIGVANIAHGVQQMPWVKKFVQVSTPEVYGSTGTYLREDQPFKPSTPYAVSRAAIDLHLEAMFKAAGFPVCFTRSVNVYGPGQQPYRIIPKTVLSIGKGRKLKLHGGGVSTRSFIHVDDMAAGILRVLLSGVPGESYHIATPEQTSIRNLVQSICTLCEADFNAVTEDDNERLGKDMAYQLNYEKIRDIGWGPNIALSEGLPGTVAWFKENAAKYEDLEYHHRP